ncbi:UBX domain protein [Ostertagia ostertagi]
MSQGTVNERNTPQRTRASRRRANVDAGENHPIGLPYERRRTRNAIQSNGPRVIVLSDSEEEGMAASSRNRRGGPAPPPTPVVSEEGQQQGSRPARRTRRTRERNVRLVHREPVIVPDVDDGEGQQNGLHYCDYCEIDNADPYVLAAERDFSMPGLMGERNRMLHPVPLSGNRSQANDIPPPIDFSLEFDTVKRYATVNECWLMIAFVQRRLGDVPPTLSVLRCPLVKERLSQHCFVTEMNTNTHEGIRMAARYGIDVFPTVVIVDPRNLMEVCRLTGEHLGNARDFLAEFNAFIVDHPNYEGREMAGQVPMDSDPAGTENNVSEGNSSGSTRKRQNVAPLKRSPKREKLDDGDEIRLSNEAGALSVADKGEWKNMVAPGSPPCVVRFRFPCDDGSRTETVQFTMNTKLAALFSFIRDHGFVPSRHLLVLSFPRREYSTQHGNKTLEELGFTKSEVIHVDHIASDGPANAGPSSGALKK